MKYLIKTFLIFIFCLIWKSNYSQIDHRSKHDKKMFEENFKLLDSAAKTTSSDTVFCCSSLIGFMVEHTPVPIKAKGTYHGFLFFTKEELNAWHIYYETKIKWK